MSTRDLAPLVALKRRSGAPVLITYFEEKASATFKAGEAVYLTGGYVDEFTAAVDDGNTRFLGFAAEDAHNDSVDGTSKVGVYVPDDDTIFEANLYHTTPASAVFAITDVGTLLPLKQLTAVGNGIVAVDKENTAAQIDCCRIIGLSKDHAVGDIYPRVQFVVEQAARTIGQ